MLNVLLWVQNQFYRAVTSTERGGKHLMKKTNYRDKSKPKSLVDTRKSQNTTRKITKNYWSRSVKDLGRSMSSEHHHTTTCCRRSRSRLEEHHRTTTQHHRWRERFSSSRSPERGLFFFIMTRAK